MGPNLYDISHSQRRPVSDSLTVDKGPILAAEVAHRHGAPLDKNHAMMAAHQVTAGAEMAILGPTNKKLRDPDRNFPTRMPAVGYNQFYFHRGVPAFRNSLIGAALAATHTNGNAATRNPRQILVKTEIESCPSIGRARPRPHYLSSE